VTLRDGGYLNDWRFSTIHIQAVATAMDVARVDVVEVGYLSNRSEAGLAAQSPPPVLVTLKHSLKDVLVAAMMRPNEASEELLRSRVGLVDLIRIPCSPDQVSAGRTIAERCAFFGFKVALNLTSVSAYSLRQLLQAVQDASGGDPPLTALYFADSRGALTPRSAYRLVQMGMQVAGVPFGFHGHDNRGLAVPNSLAAIKAGATFVDGSLEGIGLGGGNADSQTLGLALGKDFRLPGLADLGINIERNDHRRSNLYRLSGERNIEQEWVEALLGTFGPEVDQLLDTLPRRRHCSLESVLTELQRSE